MHAGGDNHTLAAPVIDHGAHEGGVLAVAQRDIFLKLESRIFLNGDRFTGQGCFFDAQVNRFQQAQISRDEVAGFQEDYVTRNQLAGGYRCAVPVTQYLCIRCGQFLEGCQCLFCTVFLYHTQYRIQHNNC